jgi:hypothetical protein
MAISTYANLQTAIANWLGRPGDSDVAAQAPDLVTLAESRINYGAGEPGDPLYSPPLRVQQMLTRATATASGEYLALPDDYLEMRGPIKVNQTPERFISYVTPQQFAESAASQSTGTPVCYTLAGSEFRFGPAPGSSLTVELWYYAKVPALSDVNTTNWLLTASPNIYLYGCLLEAGELFKIDANDLQKWAGLYSAHTRAFQRQDLRARTGGAALIQRPVVSVP